MRSFKKTLCTFAAVCAFSLLMTGSMEKAASAETTTITGTVSAGWAEKGGAGNSGTATDGTASSGTSQGTTGSNNTTSTDNDAGNDDGNPATDNDGLSNSSSDVDDYVEEDTLGNDGSTNHDSSSYGDDTGYDWTEDSNSYGDKLPQTGTQSPWKYQLMGGMMFVAGGLLFVLLKKTSQKRKIANDSKNVKRVAVY